MKPCTQTGNWLPIKRIRRGGKTAEVLIPFSKMYYNYILFDLDHTLWDFERNSAETLFELYDVYHLSGFGKFKKEDFINKFQEINRVLWALYDRNEITREYLRRERFKLVFNGLNFTNDDIALNLGDDYLRICPQKIHVIPNAIEILDYLNTRYQLVIITNGFEEVQHTKLSFSQLKKYFLEIVTSEEAGHKKPNRGIFEFAVKKINAKISECIMVGDNIETDIKGAHRVNMDIIFYNPGKITHNEKVTQKISDLLELKAIL